VVEDWVEGILTRVRLGFGPRWHGTGGWSFVTREKWDRAGARPSAAFIAGPHWAARSGWGADRRLRHVPQSVVQPRTLPGNLTLRQANASILPMTVIHSQTDSAIQV